MKLLASLLLIGTSLAIGLQGQDSSSLSGSITSTIGTTGIVAQNWSGSAQSVCTNGQCFWFGGVGGSGITRVQSKSKPKYTLAQVRASAVPIQKAKLAPAAYLTLAKSIGLESAGTDEARMLDCLDKLILKPYDADKVDAYLSHKAEAQGANMMWLWKPLRELDEKAVALGWSRTLDLSPKRYGQAVPAHALTVVAEVLREMPDAVFLVSDYEAVKPDPFLAVTTARLLQEGRVWIIEQWNEPNFGVPEMHFGPAEPPPTRLSTD